MMDVRRPPTNPDCSVMEAYRERAKVETFCFARNVRFWQTSTAGPLGVAYEVPSVLPIRGSANP